ncbi:fibronectin type III domain-containing protein, partial [candidate division KSB1 bacterium]|nr:fibronectin type III domain-containing protein [candidate division KSB1 bacterium]
MIGSTKQRVFVGAIFLLLFLLVINSNEVFGQTYKIMPLGNSLTKGVIIGNPADVTGYRDDLQALLTAESVTYDFVGSMTDGGFADNNHEGHEGFTADSVANNVTSYMALNPDIVILHIGTNDITLAHENDSTLIEINDIISQIGTSRKIVMCSLIPRWDRTAKNDSTTQLSNWIKNLYFEKLGAGYKVYYAGLNEVFKTYSDWNTATYYSDGVHLNSNGYNLMARVIYTAVMNAIRGTNPNVTDNFNRTNLGATWKADPEYVISNNELVNQATEDWWDYLATYVNIKNPNQVSIKWGATADSAGIIRGGLAMALNSPAPDVDGYLIWRYGSNLTLYEIRDGEPYQNPPKGHIDQVPGQQEFPKKGDVFKVVMRIDNDKHVFDCFINGAHDGTLYDYNKKYGASGTFYSGVMVKGKDGIYNNNTDDFTIYGQTDIEPPEQVLDLTVSDFATNTATLRWTAPGDDGDEGTATGYDIRYSTSLITELNFNDATPASGAPIPSAAGTQETYVVTGLAPSTTYFFSLKAYDDVPNYSPASNSPSVTTKESNMLVDNFNRASLGTDWAADPEMQIVANELANTAGPEGDNWNYMAVFKARANPIEASFRWSDNSDLNGIEQGGLALLLDSASPNASGYLAWCRPLSGQISLFTIEAGLATNFVGRKTVDPQFLPQPGSVFKVATITDEQGHHFIYYVDGVKIGEIIDGPTPMLGNTSTYYAGVMLHGNLNNNIDDFGIVNVGGDPSRLNMISGNNQAGPAGEPLPDSLVISVTDMNNIPVENVLVEFKVKTGGGSVDLEAPDNNIRIEAEKGSLTGTFQIESDVTAGGGAYVYTNGGDPLSGKVDLDFYVGQEGYYVIWGRLRQSQGGFTYYSYFVQVDGQPAISTSSFAGVWDFFPQQDNWIWDVVSERGGGTPSNPAVNPVEFYLTQGMHRVTIHQRYPDVIHLDKILLTLRETGYTPVGKEEFSQYITNAQGRASAEFTLGTAAGIDNATVEVTVPGYNLSGEPM